MMDVSSYNCDYILEKQDFKLLFKKLMSYHLLLLNSYFIISQEIVRENTAWATFVLTLNLCHCI